MTDEYKIPEPTELAEMPDEVKIPEQISTGAQARLAKFHLPVSIVAGLAVVVICLIRGESLFVMALWTSVAIVVFWVLGNLARYYLQTKVFPLPDESIFDEAETDGDGSEDGDVVSDEPPTGGTYDYMAQE